MSDHAKSKSSDRFDATLGDDAARQAIATQLDGNMLVEAAAGTGKTTCMVGRMINLIATGAAEIDQIAAVTFTRKAAGELRTRFQIRIEQEIATSSGQAKSRLIVAAAKIDRCFIGTIHSFCSRLLRERPVEAGVDFNFVELDDAADSELCKKAWDEFAARLHDENDPLAEELDAVGLNLSELGGQFARFAEYQDVADWPAETQAMTDEQIRNISRRISEFAGELRAFVAQLPADRGTDAFVPRVEQFIRRAELMRKDDAVEVMQLLETIKRSGDSEVKKNHWKAAGEGWCDLVVQWQGRWNEFFDADIAPALQAWREHRYPIVIKTLRRAAEYYQRIRASAGVLNFQDLLMRTAKMLRDRPNIRRYYARRFRRLLVDEFQDTDPVQAQIMFLLTATDADERDWTRCVPAAGSLFVVGDPKQSIYRFRRADISIYSAVKRRIVECGGRELTLTTNFRTVAPVLDWVNETFSTIFPSQATDFSPADCPMSPARGESSPGDGVYKTTIEGSAGIDQAAACQADAIAAAIAKSVDDGETRGDDYMILARKHNHLGLYADALLRRGVAVDVTGGATLGDLPELAMLHQCLRAVVEPENSLAMLGAMRSLFGVSDAVLYEFVSGGGRFYYPQPMVPRGASWSESLDVAFARMRKYAAWLDAPIASAVARIADDLGLFAASAGRDDSAIRAGGLYKTLELMRHFADTSWSTAQVVDYLQTIIDGQADHDTAAITPYQQSAVRIMNLHKAKGLESPIVFLADPSGFYEHAIASHVRRDSTSQGFLSCTVANGPYQTKVVASPAGWDQIERTEREFLRAEESRLLYVAATRAGRRLIVSQRSDDAKQKWNSWKAFAPRLQDSPELPLSPAESVDAPPRRELPTFGADEATVAAGRIDNAWRKIASPSYKILAVKTDTLGQSSLPRPASAGGAEGTEFGQVMHQILEAAMIDPKIDLQLAAGNFLSQSELPAAMAAELVQLAVGVIGSDLWRRAAAAKTKLAEVPIQIADQIDGSPRLRRGVIDLAFIEDGQWVIVDYKTDDRPGRDVNSLAEKYKPQVNAYAEIWQAVTGQPVKSRCLLFVRTNRSVCW